MTGPASYISHLPYRTRIFALLPGRPGRSPLLALAVIVCVCTVWAMLSAASAAIDHDRIARLPTGTDKRGTPAPGDSTALRQSGRRLVSTNGPDYAFCLEWGFNRTPVGSPPSNPNPRAHFDPLEASRHFGAKVTPGPFLDVSKGSQTGGASYTVRAANGSSTDAETRHRDVFAALFREHDWDSRDIAGYLASLLVLLTFCTRKMWTLRCAAIGSNIAFIIYGYLAVLAPVFLLHMILLPINVIRILQLSRQCEG